MPRINIIIMDDKSKKGFQDDMRIDLNQEYEVKYWSQRFGVNRDQLERAVKQVGVMVKDVEKVLRRS